MHTTVPVNWLRLSLISLAISQLCAPNVWAVTDAERIADLEKKLAQSLAQIERLANRVGELEKNKAVTPAPVPASVATTVVTPPVTPPEQESRIEAVERGLAQIAEASARAPANANNGVPLHGFADVGYASSSKNVVDNRKRGFVLGNVDFYLTPDFGDRVKALIELNFEYGEAGMIATDLERLQIGYTFNDQLTLWAGRFHTPYGYFNTAFHHGAQIQTAVLRPRLVAFEDQGGILPSHTVGLWATGGTKVADGKVEYDLYTGNGSRIVDGIIDFNARKDDNNNKVVGANLRYRFGGQLNGLILGAHAFSQKISSFTGDTFNGTTRVNMLGGYGFYDANDWEVISEYYHFRDQDLSTGSGRRSSWAGFLQVGKTFGSDLTPYFRLEKASLNQGDLYFRSQESGRTYSRQAIGLRYDINPKAAIKMELNHTDETRDGGQNYHEAHLQYAVRF